MKKYFKHFKYELMPYLSAIGTYLKGNECQNYLDCVLYHKLIAKAPRYYDRAIEYPWALRNVNLSKGKFMDVGSTVGLMFRENLPSSVVVYALNSDKEQRFAKERDINSIIGDIRNTEFKDNTFDVITCISTLEHIGVEGRYHVKSDPEGDVNAMREMLRILKPKGRLLLTVPYGSRDVLPINKLYNKERLKKLFKGYKLVSANYQKYYDQFHIWRDVSEKVAAKTDWIKERWYSIGLFILEKQDK